MRDPEGARRRYDDVPSRYRRLARLRGRTRNLPAALTHLRACLDATRPTDAPNVTNQSLRRVASYEARAERYDEAEEACRRMLDDDDADDDSIVLALCVVGTCRAKRSDRPGTVDLGHRDAASRLALRATALLASLDETRRTRKAADETRRDAGADADADAGCFVDR